MDWIAQSAPTTTFDTGSSLQGTSFGLEQFSEIISNVGDAVCMVDAHLRVCLWNEGAERLLGVPASDMLGRQWKGELNHHSAQGPESSDRRRSLIQRCLASGRPMTERSLLWDARGRSIPIESRTVPLINQWGRVIGAAEIIRDLSAEVTLQEENENLRRELLIEPLTGVLNRNGFNRSLSEQVVAMDRNRTPCGLFLADIDFFKSVNDTLGHPTGDLVLKAFAKVLVACCRPADMVSRFGGEEFAVLLPSCDMATTYERAEQVRKELEAVQMTELGERRITASFGVAELRPGDTDAKFVARADEALYRAKQRGRNRTEMSSQSEPAQAKATTSAECEHTTGWTVACSIELARLQALQFASDYKANVRENKPTSLRIRVGRPSLLRVLGLRRDIPVEIQFTFSRITHISVISLVEVTVRSLARRPDQPKFLAHCEKILEALRYYYIAHMASAEVASAG